MAETSLVAGQKRKKSRDSGPGLSISEQFPKAPYCRPAPGQALGINDQPENLRMMLSYVVRRVIRHAISESMYIKMEVTHSTLCRIFIQTARTLSGHAYADRIKGDVIFQKDMTAMV